jgi:hypothetical protein
MCIRYHLNKHDKLVKIYRLYLNNRKINEILQIIISRLISSYELLQNYDNLNNLHILLNL